jgi:hypothetical protein
MESPTIVLSAVGSASGLMGLMAILALFRWNKIRKQILKREEFDRFDLASRRAWDSYQA